MQVSKDARKKFRQSVYYIKKFGFYNHINRVKINNGNYLNYLIGIGNFIFFINKEDNKIKADLEYLIDLKNVLEQKDLGNAHNKDKKPTRLHF